MLIDKGPNRWEFNTIEDAVFVARELVAWLKNTNGIDIVETTAADETVSIDTSGETFEDNE